MGVYGGVTNSWINISPSNSLSGIVTSGLVLALDAGRTLSLLNSVEVLVVGGGGGGGGGTAGGGGAGGLIYNSNFTVTPGSALTVTVGVGGTGKVYSVSNTAGDNGGNSVFGSLTAIGGGGGGNRDTNEVGKNGGSGGGGGGDDIGVNSAGTGTSGQGFAGGVGRGGGGGSAGGGGGGAGASGQASPSSGLGGNGGDGLGFDISGTFTYYGGGGGGGSHSGKSSGGIGGGGAGGSIYSDNAVIGTPNTGGGGGGGAGGAGIVAGKNGGSGIVIVRYPGAQRATGGTVTSSGGYTIHTFTTVGSSTFTPLTWVDLSGNGNTGTLTNGPTYSSANFGSIAFDGSNDAIALSNITPTSGASFSAWININGSNSNFGAIFANWSDVGGGSAYWIGTLNNQSTTIQVYFNGSLISNITSLPLNTWMLLTISHTGSICKGYINAIEIFSLSSTLTTSTNNTSIGYDITRTNYPFKGNIAQVSIYNKALTATEISQNYNATRRRFGI